MSASQARPSHARGRCPICREPTVEAYRPFCSKRCADVDLGRWLSGAYVIPGGRADEEDRPPAPEPRDQTGKPDADPGTPEGHSA